MLPDVTAEDVARLSLGTGIQRFSRSAVESGRLV